jgi:hypothetical protein
VAVRPATPVIVRPATPVIVRPATPVIVRPAMLAMVRLAFGFEKKQATASPEVGNEASHFRGATLASRTRHIGISSCRCIPCSLS